MNLDLLAWMVLVLAGIPASMFLLNLLVYRPIGNFGSQPSESVSVLIPARNEEQNIRATLEAALSNYGCDFEIVVLDDHSTDRTPAIVRQLARRDARIRLERAPALPTGWCGKQHACFILAKLARHPLLVFIDADVRLAPDALARMAGFIRHRSAALASGVPRQELGTLS